MDLIIRQTIYKLLDSRNKNELDLNEVAILFDTQIEILIMKIEKMIKFGEMSGQIDKQSAKYIRDSLSSQTQKSASYQSNGATSSLSQSNQQSNSLGLKQIDFIKTETRETNEEDLVKLTVNLGYVGSHIRIGLKIVNNSPDPITDLSVKLLFAPTITFFKVKPGYNYEKFEGGLTLKLPNVKDKNSISLNLYFRPETLGIGELKGQFQYVNSQDFVRFIKIEDLSYNLTPPKIRPKDITPEEIESFTAQPNVKRDIRSYGLPDKLNPNVAFNYINQIASNYNFKLITKVDEEENKSAWFFGETDEPGVIEDPVMVVGQIVNNKIEFYASSYNEQVISALLTAFSIDLKKRIVNSRTVMDESEIYDVYCENCGGVLPVFPKPSEIVKCKWCQFENLIR